MKNYLRRWTNYLDSLEGKPLRFLAFVVTVLTLYLAVGMSLVALVFKFPYISLSIIIAVVLLCICTTIYNVGRR